MLYFSVCYTLKMKKKFLEEQINKAPYNSIVLTITSVLLLTKSEEHAIIFSNSASYRPKNLREFPLVNLAFHSVRKEEEITKMYVSLESSFRTHALRRNKSIGPAEKANTFLDNYMCL